MLRKLKSLGYSANLSYALGFLLVIASIVIWFTQGGTDAGEVQASGERFGKIGLKELAQVLLAVTQSPSNAKE